MIVPHERQVGIRQGQRRGPVGDLVVESTAPASFIARCPLFEGHHVSHLEQSEAGELLARNPGVRRAVPSA
jgi:hypothetical protein